MHKTLVFVAVLLCGCASSQYRAYSAGQAERNLDVMQQCAAIISKAPFPLNDAERDWHYGRCLWQNGAMI